MSDADGIEDGEAGEGIPEGGGEALALAAEEGRAVPRACFSCGAPTVGAFCANCGQKNDDLRRSLLLLGRDFVEDTFSFDSRMWRTIGFLAVAPGRVSTDYSHGQRSRYTPPVRLFLVVSFLFFLTIAATNTLFIGLEVAFKGVDKEQVELATEKAGQAGAELEAEQLGDCSFQGKLRFFIKERDLKNDRERINACMDAARNVAAERIEEADSVSIGENSGRAAEVDEATEIVDRVFNGINWAVENPREFNDAVNDWLPRVMFLMTPVLTLILGLFLRRDVLLFDHMVFALYTHAVGFVIVGASLILTQLGIPFAGATAPLALVIYYIFGVKRSYKRGWVKTVWTVLGSSAIYMLILMTILVVIVSNAVWQAAA